MATLFEEASADLSECGVYRYSLIRTWDTDKPRICWVMLNPSTADAEQDDPTIRKVKGFSRRWGYGSIEVVNLFAYRATDPRDLLIYEPIIGRDNNNAIQCAAMRGNPLVVAWGAIHKGHEVRCAFVRKWLLPQQTMCLGTTKEGYPRHPLMLSYDTPLVHYGLTL